MLKITVLTDNPKSWIIPYVEQLISHLSKEHSVTHCYCCEDIPEGDVAFFLSCEKIVPGEILKRNKHNIVVHPSKLPEGKGFAPVAWQILEDKNTIPVSMIEAVEEVDSGVIYYEDEICLEGHELNDEIRDGQGKATVRLVLTFIKDYPNITGKLQEGESTFYRRRTPADSQLDIKRSIEEQFNKLRVVDNNRYPAYFWNKGHKYIVKIYKASVSNSLKDI